MVYKYCSVETVIAMVISNTRMQDDSYADDILDWLREGLNLMRVKAMYTRQNSFIDVKGHVAELPCGLVYIDGVFYNGSRLRLGTGCVDERCSPFKVLETEFDSYFQTDPADPAYQNNQDYALLRGADIKQLSTITNKRDYYIAQPNHLQTSFTEGRIQLFWRQMPVDSRGYPLIPDEQNTRFALFWYIMAMLALTGYKHNDAKMDYDYCEDKFKEYAAEGKRIIRRWSIDKRESVLNLMVGLIPPKGYYESFFINGEQPKYVVK